MPATTSRIALALAALLVASAASRAQAQTPAATGAATPALAIPAPPVNAPNFSGTWTLDVKASSFGMMPAPSRASMNVTNAGNALSYTSAVVTGGSEQQSSASLTIGGPPFTQTMVGATAVSSATWDGLSIEFTGVLRTQGAEIPMTTRWTLSPDGAVLTATRVLTPTGAGAMTVTLVYDKKP